MLQLFQLMGLFGPTVDTGVTPVTGLPTPETRRILFTGTSLTGVGASLPEGTRVFAEAVDPYDILDFEIDVSGLLEEGESVTTATLSLPTETALLGLMIINTGSYKTSRLGNVLKFYLGINDTDQNNKAFSTGIYLPIELRVTTNLIPARRKQRTVAVRVVQK